MPTGNPTNIIYVEMVVGAVSREPVSLLIWFNIRVIFEKNSERITENTK
jgi:hypothetical protein